MGWLFIARWEWYMSQGLFLWWLLSLCKYAFETGCGAILWLTENRVSCLVAGIYNFVVANEIRNALQMVISGNSQTGKSVDAYEIR